MPPLGEHRQPHCGGLVAALIMGRGGVRTDGRNAGQQLQAWPWRHRLHVPSRRAGVLLAHAQACLPWCSHSLGRVWQMDSSGKLYVDSIMPPLIKRMGDSKVRTAGGLYARVCVCGCGGGCGGGCGCMCVWCTLAVEGCDDEWFRVFTPTPLRLYRPACASELWTWRCFSWGWPIPPP